MTSSQCLNRISKTANIETEQAASPGLDAQLINRVLLAGCPYCIEQRINK